MVSEEDYLGKSQILRQDTGTRMTSWVAAAAGLSMHRGLEVEERPCLRLLFVGTVLSPVLRHTQGDSH